MSHGSGPGAVLQFAALLQLATSCTSTCRSVRFILTPPGTLNISIFRLKWLIHPVFKYSVFHFGGSKMVLFTGFDLFRAWGVNNKTGDRTRLYVK